MKKLAIAVAIVLTLPAAANAAPCKDAKGKFTKCPPAAATMHAPVGISHPAAPHAAATHAAATARKAPCRDAKTGRFKKC